jgi:hypothetical protein
LVAGVTECGEGFVAVGDASCEAVLPATPCPDGQMAVPGDEQCREVAACGQGVWGDIPVEAGTVYVDQAYVGASTGSGSEPFTTITEALAATPARGMIAIAAGSYTEAPTLDRPVRLWGRCPSMVSIDGGSAEPIYVVGTSEVEVHGVAATSNLATIYIERATVLIDRVWAHDSGEAGMRAFGPSTVTVTGSLIERPVRYGVWTAGSDVTVEGSVIRGLTLGTHPFAQAVAVQPDLAGARSHMRMSGSLIEQSEDVGFAVFGSDAELETSVIRDTAPRSSDGEHGRGVVAQDLPMSGRAALNVRASVIERAHQTAMYIAGADVVIEQSVVRDTLASPITNQGRGIDIEPGDASGERPFVTMRNSTVERSIGGAVVLLGSEAVFEGVLLDLTRNDDLASRGFALQDSWEAGGSAHAEISHSRVNGATVAAATIINSSANMFNVLFENMLASPTGFGDGVVVHSLTYDASLSLDASVIRVAERAGLAGFGAPVTLKNTTLECVAIDIVADDSAGKAASFEDQGGNVCRCGDVEQACKAQSPQLEPPPPLDQP